MGGLLAVENCVWVCDNFEHDAEVKEWMLEVGYLRGW